MAKKIKKKNGNNKSEKSDQLKKAAKKSSPPAGKPDLSSDEIQDETLKENDNGSGVSNGETEKEHGTDNAHEVNAETETEVETETEAETETEVETEVETETETEVETEVEAETEATEKRGRHKKDCDCEKCKAKKAAKENPDAKEKEKESDTVDLSAYKKTKTESAAAATKKNMFTEKVDLTQYISGALFLICIDGVLPSIALKVAGWVNRKYKGVDAKLLRLTPEEQKRMEPLAEAVVKLIFGSVNPIVAFAVTMGMIYAGKFMLLEEKDFKPVPEPKSKRR